MPIREHKSSNETIPLPREHRRYRHHRRAGPENVFSKPMNPGTKRTVIAVLLFLGAILSTLSFFNLAGIVGIFINNALSLVFGMARYVVPILLVIWAVRIEKQADTEKKPHHIIGFILFLLGLNGLFHFTLPLDQMVEIARQGYRGGIVGLALSWPLVNYMGVLAATPILILLTLIGLVLITNITLSDMAAFLRKVGGALSNTFSNSLMYTRARLATNNAVEEEEPGFSERPLADADEELEEDEEYEDDDEEVEEVAGKQLPLPVLPKKHVYKPLPSYDLLAISKAKPAAGDVKASAQIILDTLKQFGIGAEMGEIRVGPTVTQYSIKPERGIKLTRITALCNDLALALSAHPIRIEAPIPGKPFVGIEVPNERVALVTLRELLESEEFRRRDNNMTVAVGKDVSGKTWVGDITRMPHLLVAGATGSGKTVCLNTIILGLLYQNTEETLKFIMVDPKRVELSLYNGIPHLLTPVVTDVNRTVNSLKWLLGEMDRRFDLFSKAGARDFASYNKKAVEKIPHIVFVVDELADLMQRAGHEVETLVIRLAQLSRATGIHLILATQRPSVDVITGLMKANIPTRIAFSVASIVDSRTILDMAGADKLLGRGDMLYLTAELSRPRRLQGAYVSEEELKRVVDYLKADTAPEYNPLVTEVPTDGPGSPTAFAEKQKEHDPMFEVAKELAITTGIASTSFLQRRLSVGYSRAARIIDQLEAAGIVGPANGSKGREVLLGVDGSDKINGEKSFDAALVGSDNEDVDADPEWDEEEEGEKF